ncbi:AAA family ATPase [Burkholderia anthina]|uniref:AAA family ATPase n=1 Tax=Burkholderia anthina TaxID=179879 RepID=A0A7T6VH70_9BURK|nr:AAA family ATPase [Burkholderia anthina]QQK03794.1 AAA family ATPase [Burkholderia anthina]
MKGAGQTDLGAKEAAKARTLRVLFNFVRLEAKEILELGRDFKDPSRPPTATEIEQIAEKKRERSILLQSASTLLTQEFKDWWKQGDYRFRFEADGDHFRIWVSDDRRPEEVELESRSTGLQWFLSFYLVFLVESDGDHQDAVLLLDEPGLSLHPLAQRDLSKFFENLAQTNRIIYTTHSPFLVDADRLDRVRKVYVSEDGTTRSSPNLRQTGADPAQAGAAYAVYSALNLNVAESLLLGCTPVVVEGASDQHYLTLMKALLIGAGKISPRRELVFPPAGGTKTLRITASILTGRDEVLPVVLLDGDSMGTKMATELRTSLYRDEPTKVLTTNDYAGFGDSELEDLVPADRFVDAVDRMFRNSDRPFEECFKKGEPVVPQVESWAEKEGIALPQGWKVEVAKRVKQTTLNKGIHAVEAALVDAWVRLFERIDSFSN